ncbi:unnamed protein product [Amoebophrya sp. A25]|nr:unnamed protein product [Amoebophrya sp. A25]|eukprot:GSA25T00004550001.1
MEERMRAHKRGDCAILGRMKRRQDAVSGRAVGDLRFEVGSEQHAYCRQANSLSVGSDARMSKIEGPRAAWSNEEKNRIKCRKCQKFEMEFNKEKQTLKSLAKRFAIMRAREDICKKKKNKQMKAM